MIFRPSAPCFVAAAVALSAAIAPARAELASSSPFLPPGGQQVVAPTNSAPLELRGVMATGNTTMFSIFDPSKKSGTWVGLNESGYDFSVKKYDADNDTVTVEHQGRTHVLAMRTPKIASLGNAVAPPPATAPAVLAPPNPVTRNVTATPTPATEAARLADWQAEIQRRRDMRAQAATTPGGAAPVQVAPPVQPQAQPAQPQQQNQQGNQRQRGGPQRQRNGS
ncbi:MAG TPA: hypothetical protein VHO24_15230 [Opitutaceae bacterium]|nr:hypothetical protein [Opitutaceae bacterium]